MAQIFKPAANSITTATLLGIAIGVPTIWLAIAGLSRSPANTKVNVPKNQPVPFSHQHHNWELGIDCRYCHGSVEKSGYAGLPATEVCMSCHSQVWVNSPLLEPVRQSYETGQPIKWNLVNKLPDFVHFNHSSHISKGINCNTCHGPVQNMHITWKGNAFQMAWCLNCHRAPERYLYQSKETVANGRQPRQQVFDLYWKYQTYGLQGLTNRERTLMIGSGDNSGTVVGVSEAAADKAKGRELIAKYGIKVQQLADCSVCHY